MRATSVLVLILVMAIQSCTVGPKPIDYGKDACHYCKMTIVDQQHGAEVVTQKGKVYKFDAVECMLNYGPELGEEKVALHLCNHYTTPGELIGAKEATFLISEGIPSPMGAYLTAFESEQEALDALEIHGGKLYNWIELINEWDDNYVYSK